MNQATKKQFAGETSNVAEIYAFSVDNKFINYNMYLYSLITGFAKKEGKMFCVRK